MKKLSYLLAVSAMSGMIGASSAWAGKTIVVVNQTPFTLNEFYASPSDYSGDWVTGGANNLLAGVTVGPGGQTTITINDGTAACTYDLMSILDGQDNHAYQYQVNACGGGGTWAITSDS